MKWEEGNRKIRTKILLIKEIITIYYLAKIWKWNLNKSNTNFDIKI